MVKGIEEVINKEGILRKINNKEKTLPDCTRNLGVRPDVVLFLRARQRIRSC
jgi:hypothetical protein